jgi:hypothetical protein
MSNEIDTAREVLRKHKKLCPDSVKELRDKTDMPMSECCDMLRCLWRDAKLERLQAENAKLRKLAAEMYPYAKAFLQQYLILGYIDSKSYDWFLQLREMGIEVDE